MRVNSQTAQNLENAQGANQSKRTDKAAAAAKSKSSSASSGVAADASAKTEISSRAKEMAQAKAVAAQTPDVRDERVERLKKMIAEGKYKVDEKAVADRMVKEHLEV